MWSSSNWVGCCSHPHLWKIKILSLDEQIIKTEKKSEWMSSWSQNKYKINRIRNPSIEVNATKEEEQKIQLIIIFLQHVSSLMWWCLLIWCNLWVNISRSCSSQIILSDNGTTKRQFARTRSSFYSRRPLFVLLLTLCDQIINQNEFLFTSNVLEWRQSIKSSRK